MAGKDPPSKGKTALKSPGSMKGKDSTPNKRVQFESMDSSDSEEGFIDEMDFVPSTVEGKSSNSNDTPKSGKKSSLDSLKSGKKSSLGSLKSGKKSSLGSLKSGKKSSLDSLKSAKKSSLDSLKSGATGAGDGAQGVKNYKTGNTEGQDNVPTGVPLIIEVPHLNIDLPKNAELLMDCEAAAVLNEIQDYLPSITTDPSVKVPVAFNKALQFAKSGEGYTNPEPVREVLEKLKPKGVSDGEICMIANVCPETIDEVYALIPSLKVKRQTCEKAIEDSLRELEQLKKVQ